MQARPDRDAAIQLRAGESLFVYLKAGTTITGTAGGLKLTGAPRWLEGQVFRTQATLAEGEAWLPEDNGWVMLTATRGGSTVHICRAEAPLKMMEWLRQAISTLRPGHTARNFS
ncbi:MAG: hypothetical protein V4542_16190 [Pseudomonadota bacterium]